MSTIKKECRVVMLPATNQYKGSFSIMPNGKLQRNVLVGIPQELYILSNNRIHKNDYYFLDGEIRQQPTELINLDVQLFTGAEKVIATTDRLNIHPNVSDSYRSGNCVPRIKDSFIDRFIESYNRGECIDSVIINFEQYDFRPDNSMGYFEPGAFTYKLKAETNEIDNTINISL